MTTTPQPLGTVFADRMLRFLAWASQAGAAATYLAVLSQPSAWRPVVQAGALDAACFGMAFLCMALLWPYALWMEQKYFYDRRRWQPLHRRGSLIGHGFILLATMAAASAQPGRVAMWVFLPILAFVTTAVWIAWMRTRFLPAEDQAVIDEIGEREDRKVAAAHKTGELERRRQRLDGIVTGLGYQLTHDQTAHHPNDAPEPAVRWQIPAKKHSPLVYFIRNGNRIKIGTTTELKRRIRTLALRSENVALLLSGDVRLERDLHRKFAALRVGNTEWFAYEGALADYVRTETDRIARKDQTK